MSDPIRYTLAFLVPLIVTWVATPWAARIAHRVGMVDHPKEGRFHSDPTPYLGGLAVAAGLILIGGVAAGAEGQLLVLLLCGVALGAVGFVDDWRSIGPLMKIAIEAACGLALWLVGVRAGFFGVPALDLLLTIGWVVAVTNALNLLDNMDGLSSGVVAIAGVTFFAIAAQRGDYLVGSFALAIAGASLGFLRHNFPPAKIFLGDAGSLMLGFFLAGLALKLDLVGPGGTVRALIVLLIVGVPLFDTLLVFIARARDHRPVYLGGTDHSSHRLSMRGVSPRNVAFVTYAAQVVCCGIALSLAHAPRDVIIVSLTALTGLTAGVLLLMLRMPHPVRSAPEETVLAESEEQETPAETHLETS